MDRINDIVDSKFRYILLSSTRAEQMIRRARSKIENPKGKHIRVAMNELLDQRVEWGYGPAPEPEVSVSDVEGEGIALTDGTEEAVVDTQAGLSSGPDSSGDSVS